MDLPQAEHIMLTIVPYLTLACPHVVITDNIHAKYNENWSAGSSG